MRIERQREIVGRLLDLASDDSTLLADDISVNPVSNYVGRQRWEAERDLLFRRRPTVVALSGDLARPGDHVATDAGGVPVLVMRGDDGVLRGFVNICRHRGSPLAAPGSGASAGSLRCGFHGWVYDRSGTVIGRPHAAGGFDTLGDRCDALIPRPVAEAHGLVFVRGEGDDPIDSAELLGPLAAELDEFGFGAYHRFDSWVSAWPANWKLLIDTFLENYHVPALHPTTVARYFLVRPSLFDPLGPNLRFHSMQKSILELADTPEDEWELLPHGTVEYLVAPNTILNFSVDHLAVYRFLPTAVDHTRVELTVYTTAPADEMDDTTRDHYRRTLELHERVSGGEDFAQQVTTHAALASGGATEVVFGRNEPAAIHFHRQLDRLLR